MSWFLDSSWKNLTSEFTPRCYKIVIQSHEMPGFHKNRNRSIYGSKAEAINRNGDLYLKIEPRREKTGPQGFRPGLTQTELYKHRRRLESGNFGFRK